MLFLFSAETFLRHARAQKTELMASTTMVSGAMGVGNSHSVPLVMSGAVSVGTEDISLSL